MGTEIKPGELKTKEYNFKTKTKRINLTTFKIQELINGKEM
jgi:hypothetical protein